MSTPSPRPPRARKFAGESVNIAEPQPFGAITLVRGDGSGSICAFGDVSGSEGAIFGAWAKVYPTLQDVPQDPAAPPPADAVAGYCEATEWYFGASGKGPEVPGAACVANPTTNTGALAVWCEVAPYAWVHSATSFAGKCSDRTNCTGGTGSGPGFYFERGRPAQVVAIAPERWGVEVVGFAGKVAGEFNKSWTLGLSDAPYLWHNGGDGTTTPRVELSCDGPNATEWRLTLRLGGSREQFAAPAVGWRNLAANSLKRQGSGRGQGPDTLTVSPA